jgi:hypothetical protein
MRTVVGNPAYATGGDLLARLRGVAKGREVVDVAQLHFVGLDKIEKAYGARWRDHKPRIQEAAESYLRKRIGSSDLLVRGEGGFLIVLGAAAGAEAHAITAQLTHGLNAFFTGSLLDGPAPRVDGAVQSFPAKDLERTLGRGDDEHVQTAADAPARIGAVNLEWKFEPVWDVKREALSHCYVTPFDTGTSARIPGYRFETGAVHPSQLIRVDETALWTAEQALLDFARQGKQGLVGVTIHAQSLASLTSRARLLASIDRLNPELHRFRIIKIAGVSQGFPRLYLNEIVGVLRSRLPNVVLLVAWDEPDIASLLHPGLSGLGFVVPGSGVTSGPVVATPALMARANEARRLAHGARMRFLVEGAITKYLALKFVEAGADNIASSAIWQARATASSIQTWRTDQLVAA